MAPARKRKSAVRNAPFLRLPFELQSEIFQYLLVEKEEAAIYLYEKRRMRCPGKRCRKSSCTLRARCVTACYHEYYTGRASRDLNGQLLRVCRDFNRLSLKILYGHNKFGFINTRDLTRFTTKIGRQGSANLRHVVFEFHHVESFRVGNLRRLFLSPIHPLSFKVIDLNFVNRTKGALFQREYGFSDAALRLLDVIQQRETPRWPDNDDMVGAIRKDFDVDMARVWQHCERAVEVNRLNWIEDSQRKIPLTNFDKFSMIRLMRKSS